MALFWLLIDENLRGELLHRIGRRSAGRGDAVIYATQIGDEDAPPLGTPDPEILRWCSNKNNAIVTNDRRTMPAEFGLMVMRGERAPTLLVARPRADYDEIVQSILLIAGATDANEREGQLIWVPL